MPRRTMPGQDEAPNPGSLSQRCCALVKTQMLHLRSE